MHCLPEHLLLVSPDVGSEGQEERGGEEDRERERTAGLVEVEAIVQVVDSEHQILLRGEVELRRASASIFCFFATSVYMVCLI